MFVHDAAQNFTDKTYSRLDYVIVTYDSVQETPQNNSGNQPQPRYLLIPMRTYILN
jgi:hypothetical protein